MAPWGGPGRVCGWGHRGTHARECWALCQGHRQTAELERGRQLRTQPRAQLQKQAMKTCSLRREEEDPPQRVRRPPEGRGVRPGPSEAHTAQDGKDNGGDSRDV